MIVSPQPTFYNISQKHRKLTSLCHAASVLLFPLSSVFIVFLYPRFSDAPREDGNPAVPERLKEGGLWFEYS
jgi:hypothetical protein